MLDTNALLNLFRYPKETRDGFLSLLESEKERLWIPHHVGAEFQRRRLSIPTQQKNALKTFDTEVRKVGDQLKSSLNGFQRHMPEKSREFTKLIDRRLNALKDEIKEQFQDYQDNVLDAEAHDETFQKITELFDGRVGKPYDPNRLVEIHSEGEQRYRLQIPPGYEDAGKSSNQYGDLIVWYQILDYVQENKRPVFFVTDDETEDWWTRENNRPFAARQELVDEFLSHSSGKLIKFYLPSDFLKDAWEHGKVVQEETVEQVTTYADERRKATQPRPSYMGSADYSGAISAIKQLQRGVDLSNIFQNSMYNFPAKYGLEAMHRLIANSGLQNVNRGLVEDSVAAMRNAEVAFPGNTVLFDIDKIPAVSNVEDWEDDFVGDENEDEDPSEGESSSD